MIAPSEVSVTLRPRALKFSTWLPAPVKSATFSVCAVTEPSEWVAVIVNAAPVPLSAKVSVGSTPLASTEAVTFTPASVMVFVVSVPAGVTDSEPVSRLRPLNRVRVAMFPISFVSERSSSPIAWRSEVDRVVEPACTVSSRMRWRIAVVSDSAPSAVWIIDTPSCALRRPCCMPLIWARIFSLIARPAASSAARLMRRPLESCSSALPIFMEVMPRLR